MTQILSDVTRWLGVAVAIVGAMLANPDATEHAVREFGDRWVVGWQRFRGSLTKHLKFLRRDATFESAPDGASTSGGTTPVTKRVWTSWAVAAATKKDLDFLAETIERLSEPVTSLWHGLDVVTVLFKDELNEAVRSLRAGT